MHKKKLLIFAHYYYPDTASTGQILTDLAEGMLDDFDVTVICTVPSYNGLVEERYKDKKYYHEIIHDVEVIRVRVPEFTKADKKSRIKNIITYFVRAIMASGKVGKVDYVFALSQPPILGGILGVIVKRIKHAKLIYSIQDFNPEQAMVVGYFKNQLLLKAALLMDKFSCKHSDLVITVGCDLVETLRGRFKGKKVPRHTMINNWVDETLVYPLPQENEGVKAFKKANGLENKFVILYSGNIGLYYDLLNIVKVIERFMPGVKTPGGREVVFAFIGAGAVLEELETYTKEHQMSNVVFIPYQGMENLVYSLNAGDVHWCVNSKGIKGVSCPSKFYGIAAVAKPVLGVLEEDSEVELIIDKTKCGLVCEPGDYEQIAKNINWFIEHAESDELVQMGESGHQYLVTNLTKEFSVRKYIDAIEMLDRV